MVIKVDTCLFISKTVIYVVYVYYCIFWAHSQSDIDKVMKSFKEDGPSYNWEHSKGESVSELLGCILVFQTALIHIVLGITGIEHCNGLLIPTKVEAPLGTYANISESNIDWTN